MNRRRGRKKEDLTELASNLNWHVWRVQGYVIRRGERGEEKGKEKRRGSKRGFNGASYRKP